MKDHGRLSARWAAVGDSQLVGLHAVELRMVEIPFLDPVSTSRGVHRHRRLVFVRVVGEAEGTTVEGWGECAALGDATYDREDASDAFQSLEQSLLPQLLTETSAQGGRLPKPSGLDRDGLGAGRRPLAFAALEMAVADAHLRAERRSFATVIGVSGRTVEPGAVVGTFESVDALLARVEALADVGYTRVKMKIGPGWDVEPLEAVRAVLPDLGLQVDANESYGRSDDDHLSRLDPFGLLCLEQPFERADLRGHVRLAARLHTPICLDESLASPRDVAAALERGACSVVCVKPSRLGGIGSALEVIDQCTASGVPLWMGGMFESGFARGINATLGALPGFAWPGDLSPARSYLVDDLVGGTGTDSDSKVGLAVPVPTADGFGPQPDLEAVVRLSSQMTRQQLTRD